MVKKTSVYTFSQELRGYVAEYSLKVKSLLKEYNMSTEPSDVLRYGVKGLDLHNFKDNDDFLVSLSYFAYNLEEEYIKSYKKQALAESKKSGAFIDKDEDDIFLSLATVRRHLKEALELQ